ncbi:MAG: ATP-binding cassette domain-containing protein [Planctomycetota bacterium]
MHRVQPVLAVEGFQLQRRSGFRVGLPRLHLHPRRAVGLFAPSGGGKSSLLQALFGIAPAAGDDVRGAVQAFGRDLNALREVERRQILRNHTAWLLQDAQAALDPLQQVGDQVRQATYCSQAECTAALRELGVDEADRLVRRHPHQISGGQAQRVLFAVAALRRPELVVADEPTASLDDRTFAVVAARLRALRDAGAAILLATHDHRLLRELEAEVLVLQDGAFVPGAASPPPWPTGAAGIAAGEVPVLRAQVVAKRLGGRAVLNGVDLELHRGEVVVVVGGSGQGKTTLARILAGHLPPDSGRVDRPMRRGAVQLLCQDAASSLTPGRTLGSLLDEARAPFFDIGGALASLSLPASILERTVAEMSGGERRRAALLRALAVHPDVLVLDEPTASLDRAAAIAVVNTLMELREQRGLALVVVTHDSELAEAIGHKVLTLTGGRT